MRGRGAVILAVLTALAPACGGGSGGAGGAPPLVFTPLVPVDTSSPDHTIDTSQSDSNITAQLNTALAAGGIIVFNNGGTPKTIVLSEQLDLPSSFPLIKPVVLDGKGNVTLSGSTSGRILLKRFQTDLTLQRLAFVDATTTTPPPVKHEGAAILTEWDGYLTVINCTFTNCKTSAAGPDIGGGAIRPLGQRRLQVSGCTFTDCDGSNGGAIDSIGSQITLINSTFTGCNAFGTGGGLPSGNGGIGGAVYVDGVSQNSDAHRLDIVGCTFTNNSANDHGGALFGYTIKGTGSVVNIDQCTFSGNSVTDTSAAVGFGGAIYQQNNRFTLTRSTINGNSSTFFGGGVWSSCKSGTIENCTFQGNQAQGGVDPNKGKFGGALSISGTILINSCTISGNHAQDWGGGIFAGTPRTITLNNTLLMNNTGGNISNGWNVNETLGNGKNNLQWPAGGVTNLPARPDIVFLDAQLQPLADNTGPTKTMAIPAGSPAIDAGNDKTAPDTDQRGLPRVGIADIGAFEKQ